MKITVGDAVRVHYHPPGRTMSFVEGVVSRVDLPVTRGRVFVVDVTSDVVGGDEQPIRPGCQRYIQYEGPQDFPGRIEMLFRTEWEIAPEVEIEREPKLVGSQAASKRSNVIRAIFGRGSGRRSA